MRFADQATVFARAGRGGDGVASFRREPFTPRGGPDGGDGGPGGSVVLEVSSSIRDLAFFLDHPHQRAEPGRPGGPSNRKGGAGRDRVLLVPDGTLVRDERGLVADMVGEGVRVVAARGGRPGRGNASLAGPANRAPRNAEPGEQGEERRLELELRIVADVGLVGLPNAGKSTLLSRLTRAHPAIADYPFTTLSPNLGVTTGEERFVLADVPGLIEGAHEGKGLGLQFLRHVMRCRALAIVVDASGQDPALDLATVRRELALYDPELERKPFVVALTKADLVDTVAAEAASAELSSAGGGDVVVVSGVTGEGVEALRLRLEQVASRAAAMEPEREPFVVLRPGRERFTVRREGERFRVVGRDVERWVGQADVDDPAAVRTLQKRLVKEGVERALAEAGARRGDEVLIGGTAFEFFPEEE